MQFDIFDSSNKKVGTAEGADEIFSAEVKPHLLHDVVVSQLAGRRRGTHKTKGRSEVRGGGRKPWKQKGTGRARAGTIRSPLFRGGGVVFGPTPRDYSIKLTKKVKRGALVSALSLKASESALRIIDELNFTEPKTKSALEILKTHGLLDKKVLVVIDGADSTDANGAVEKSFRNIPTVNLVKTEGVNVYDLLNADVIVMTRIAFEKTGERVLGGK